MTNNKSITFAYQIKNYVFNTIKYNELVGQASKSKGLRVALAVYRRIVTKCGASFNFPLSMSDMKELAEQFGEDAINDNRTLKKGLDTLIEAKLLAGYIVGLGGGNKTELILNPNFDRAEFEVTGQRKAREKKQEIEKNDKLLIDSQNTEKSSENQLDLPFQNPPLSPVVKNPPLSRKIPPKKPAPTKAVCNTVPNTKTPDEQAINFPSGITENSANSFSFSFSFSEGENIGNTKGKVNSKGEEIGESQEKIEGEVDLTDLKEKSIEKVSKRLFTFSEEKSDNKTGGIRPFSEEKTDVLLERIFALINHLIGSGIAHGRDPLTQINFKNIVALPALSLSQGDLEDLFAWLLRLRTGELVIKTKIRDFRSYIVGMLKRKKKNREYKDGSGSSARHNVTYDAEDKIRVPQPIKPKPSARLKFPDPKSEIEEFHKDRPSFLRTFREATESP